MRSAVRSEDREDVGFYRAFPCVVGFARDLKKMLFLCPKPVSLGTSFSRKLLCQSGLFYLKPAKMQGDDPNDF
jgi:hypothetical protein